MLHPQAEHLCVCPLVTPNHFQASQQALLQVLVLLSG